MTKAPISAVTDTDKIRRAIEREIVPTQKTEICAWLDRIDADKTTHMGMLESFMGWASAVAAALGISPFDHDRLKKVEETYRRQVPSPSFLNWYKDVGELDRYKARVTELETVLWKLYQLEGNLRIEFIDQVIGELRIRAPDSVLLDNREFNQR